MEMEIEIVSREKIKPTSPTPEHLKLYKISLLDQIIPPVYAPAILYFPPHPTSNNPTSISQRIHLLKNSLSLSLTHFYPFAGIFKDTFTIDCNDDGLPFFVAKVVKSQLRDFLRMPDMQLINKLLPSEFSWNEGAGPGSSMGSIQLNCFECGGMAICVIFAHHIGDIATLSMFLKCWAAIARGCEDEVVGPDYVASSVFPHKASMQKESYLFVPLQKFLNRGKFVTRRYVFDANAISSLKGRSRNSNGDETPTRVEAVSAFIWKCFMEASVEQGKKTAAAGKYSSSRGEDKPFLLTQPVNLRRRVEPPFPDNSFGNFLWLAAAKCTEYSPTDIKDLVCELKRAMSRIDKDFMKRLESENGYYENLEDLRKAIPEEAIWFAFSSWAKIGLYDIDFGWGKTVWLTGFVSGESSLSVLPNSATLIETRGGDGIEAWVILDQELMTTFEKNEELKIYACFNPGVDF